MGMEKSDLKNADVVKCDNCGANMVFDVASGALKCPYCSSSGAIEAEAAIAERDYFSYIGKGDVEETGISYLCKNCNAHTYFSEFETAHNCPFCGAACILDADQIPGLKPDSLLPFKVTKEEASECGKKWIKGKLFAPSKAKKQFSVDNIRGVYSPCFSYSSNTASTYNGQLGKHYTVTVGSGKNRHTEVRTRWFNVSGNYDKYFPNVLIESSKTLNQRQMDKLGPFDIGNAKEYKKEFLAGFSAERYDNSLENCFKIAEGKMTEEIKRGILSRYSYDVVGYLNVNTRYLSVRFRHILMPLWVCGFYFKTKLYNFFVNGRTGRSTGKSPVSALRVTIAALLALGLIALIVYFLKSSGVI